MAQLSAQSIHRLCQPTKWFRLAQQQPMIVPFIPDKIKHNGKSYGLSGASYDVRIEEDLILGPNPGVLLAQMMVDPRCVNYSSVQILDLWRERLSNYPPFKALAHTMEDFFMPHNVVGYVCDKSTYARVFVSAFNTLFDPGFKGNGTLELVNLGDEVVEYQAGDPVCQFAFHWLDKKTKRPYDGKYQHQTHKAHAARYELPGGGWTENPGLIRAEDGSWT
jgi:deoxycytidine triphosphate deaminase